jgi:penicillin-binding protein 2
MSTLVHDVDWHELAEEARADALPATPRRRLRWILAVYAGALMLVLGRAVQLELNDGAAFREVANRPIETIVPLEAERGRILARDGTVLAADRQAQALAIHYRYLQFPLDERWLKRQARERLKRADHRDAAKVRATEEAIRAEIAQLHRRLAALSGINDAQWQKRVARIERRVDQMAAEVNRRRQQNFVEQTATLPDDESLSLASILAGLFAPPQQLPPAEITVAEQAAYHRVVDELSQEVAEKITATPAAYPGVKVVPYIRRHYPHSLLAANIIGHVGSPSVAQATIVATRPDAEPPAVVGLLGVERQFQDQLTGRPGSSRHLSDRRGELLATHVDRKPLTGHDVILTLDVELQSFAEQLLDRFARRQNLQLELEQPLGSGAVVVMDVQSGEMLAAASQPRFDPNWFATGDPRIEAVLHDAGRPLFDRATRMAIPPGSVFKPLTGIALLEHGIVRADSPFECQGYLDDPERMRCQIFRHHGIGHGEVTLGGALAQSCNVYFFHHARALEPASLIAWARRFGFGGQASQREGQAAGHLPLPAELRQPSDVQLFAIGQGTLTATPLEVLRMYAAIANGGYLVAPRFTCQRVSGEVRDMQPSPRAPTAEKIAGLADQTLESVRAGLLSVVEDAAGTAFDTVRISDFAIAGKTGTAETGGEADHAWFAGYAPAGSPRVAFVVVLEHGGSGSTAAGTIARHLVQRMRELQYFPSAAQRQDSFPPGKG